MVKVGLRSDIYIYINVTADNVSFVIQAQKRLYYSQKHISSAANIFSIPMSIDLPYS